MKKKYLLFSILLLAVITAPKILLAVDYTMREGTATNGVFLATTAANWSTDGGVTGLGAVPTTTVADNITVPAGVTIVWGITSQVCGTLTVNGTLNFYAPIIRIGTIASGSSTLTVSSTAGLTVGMKVFSGTNVAGIVNRTISSIDNATTITLSGTAGANVTNRGIAFLPSAAAITTTASTLTVNALAGASTGSIGVTAQGTGFRFATDANYTYQGTALDYCLGFVNTAANIIGGSVKLTQNAAINSISFMNGAAPPTLETGATINTSGVLTLPNPNSAIQVGTMLYSLISGSPTHGMFVTAVNSATEFQLSVSPASLLTAGTIYYTNNHIDLNGFQLTVSGTINTSTTDVPRATGAGFFKGNSSSSLIFSTGIVATTTNYSITVSPGTLGTLTVNSALPFRPGGTGSAVTINNLNIGATNVNVATGSGFTLGTGNMAVSPGARFTVPASTTVDFNNRPVTLQASASANGYISNLGTISNASNVTVQQWVTGQRGYRILSNPFTTTLTPSTIGTANAITITGINDVKTYNNGSNTWNNNISSIAARQPYAVFIRGLAGEVTGLSYSNGPSAFAYGVSGTMASGTSVDFTPNATGFTLIGNPFPAPINSQTLTSATAAMSYYVYNVTQGFTDTRVKSGGWTTALSSGATTPVPVMGVIAYEAGNSTLFSATTSSLNFANPATTNLFSEETVDKNLELQLTKDGYFHDNVFLRENISATDLGNERLDLKKFKNDISNIYTIATDNTKLGVDTRKSFSKVPLGIDATMGKYTFSVTNNNLSNANEVYLLDKQLKTKTLLEKGAAYSFDITNNSASFGDNRFEIVTNTKVAVGEIAPTDIFSVKVLGNIVKDMVKVQINGARGVIKIIVTDVQGKVITSNNSSDIINTVTIKGGSGIYFMKVIDGDRSALSKIIKL